MECLREYAVDIKHYRVDLSPISPELSWLNPYRGDHVKMRSLEDFDPIWPLSSQKEQIMTLEGIYKGKDYVELQGADHYRSAKKRGLL